MIVMPVVDFSEIFYFAEKKLGWSWNLCNDKFFREEIIRYHQPTEFYLADTQSEIQYQKEERKATYQCLVDFMLENNIEEMLVKS